MASAPPLPPPGQSSPRNYAYALPNQIASTPYPPDPPWPGSQYYPSAPPPQQPYSSQSLPNPYSQSLPPAAVPSNTYSLPYALPPQNAHSYSAAPAAATSGASQYYPPPQQSYQYPPNTSDPYGAPPQSIPQQTAYYPSAPTQSAPNAPAPRTHEKRLPLRKLKGDVLATVFIQDGDDPKSFDNAETLNRYTKMFPEAENDQGCRLFMYGPKCPDTLLMALFEHFDFSRYSLFPYGLMDDFAITSKTDAGCCKCQRCTKGENCGHWALHRGLQFYLLQGISPSSNEKPKVEATSEAIVISSGDEQASFLKADWNLQIFRFRSRRVETTEFAYDALMFQNYQNTARLRSAPLDYLLSQLEVVLENWNALLTASSHFLESFRFEVLQERLKTDRKIVRNLVSAAQRWEEFRRVLQTQLTSLEPLENIHLDPRWIEGREDYWQVHAVCASYQQQFKNVDFRICTELIKETDILIQRVTNLISIDEGYRSREQNDSIRRLSWITFIFLPLIFAAGIFGMNVDLFSNDPSWLYYLYTSLVVMFIAFGGYVLLRSRRRATNMALMIVVAPFALLTFLWEQLSKLLPKRSKNKYKPVVDLENQEPEPNDEFTTKLKWAAGSGRTDIIHRVLQESKRDRAKASASLSSGEAIMMAIKNGHEDAAKYLIESEHFEEYTDESDMTLLHWAAKYGQASVIERLVSKGMTLNAKDGQGRTPLDYALEGDDENTINLLLKGGKHISRQDTVDIQSMHYSARMGDISMIRKLHEKGSSLETRDGKGQTVIFHAVKGKQYATMKFLLENNANIHAVDRQGFTVLHIAAQECDLEATKMLVEKGANVNALSSERMTPLHCIANDQGVDVLKYLVDKGAEIDAPDRNLDRIAHKIARKGDTAALLWKCAYDLGCSVTVPGKQGNTPAHLAAESGSVAILKHLVENSVDVRACKDIAGYTPLMVAARAGKADAVRFLLENGCTHEIADSSGKTLVELVIRWGDPAVMQALQDHGAKFDDIYGDAPHPAWHAILEGQVAGVKQLLDNGLDPNYTYRGISLLQCAIEAGNTAVARLLMEAGAATGKADSHGWTPLHSAAFYGDMSAFILALGNAKGNRSPKDEYGWTPLDLAAFYRHEDIVKALDPEGKVTEFAWSNRAQKSSIKATHFYVPPMEDSAVTGFAEATGPAR